MSLTKVTYSMVDGASVNVKDFGAVGDGIADDSNAIQAAIDYVMAEGYGGEIWFPQGQYRVTKTIELIGDYTAPKQPRGIRLVGAMGTQNMNPSSADVADTARNAYIFGDGIAADKPVFYCWGGNNNSFEHLCIFGAKNSESATTAFACVWVDFNHENYRFYDCKFGLASIGIRVCSSYNYSTQAWTPAISAYDGTTFLPNTLTGGFASDNHYYENCTFKNSLAGLAIESAQALLMSAVKCLFITPETGHGVYITACQSISFYDATTLGKSFIYVIPQASTGRIVSYNHHIENIVPLAYVFTHDNFTPLGQGCSIQTGGGGTVSLKGAVGTPQSTFSIKNSVLSGLIFNHEGMSAVVENSSIEELNKTTGALGDFIKLTNVSISTLIGNWNAFKRMVVENTTLPGFTALSEVPLISSASAPSFSPGLTIAAGLAQTPAVASQILGVNHIYINADSYAIGVGGHFTPAGTFITDASAGQKITTNISSITVDVWSGATIGAIPATTTIFNSSRETGMFVPQRTSDGSVPVGSMYYNTVTGKFRRRDASGFADF